MGIIPLKLSREDTISQEVLQIKSGPLKKYLKAHKRNIMNNFYFQKYDLNILRFTQAGLLMVYKEIVQQKWNQNVEYKKILRFEYFELGKYLFPYV